MSDELDKVVERLEHIAEEEWNPLDGYSDDPVQAADLLSADILSLITDYRRICAENEDLNQECQHSLSVVADSYARAEAAESRLASREAAIGGVVSAAQTVLDHRAFDVRKSVSLTALAQSLSVLQGLGDGVHPGNSTPDSAAASSAGKEG